MARGGESPGVPATGAPAGTSSSSYTKPQIANTAWGFFFGARETTRRVGCAARTDQDADMPVRAAHPTVDPLTPSRAEIAPTHSQCVVSTANGVVTQVRAGLRCFVGINKKATLKVAFGVSGQGSIAAVFAAAGAGLVDAYARELRQQGFDLLPDPLGEDLAGWVFQARDVVQVVVVELPVRGAGDGPPRR